MTSRRSRRVLILGMFVCALSGMTSLPDGGFSAEAWAEEPATLEDYCQSWARNGAMGASVFLKGGNRQITYIDENELRYLIKHQLSGNNLYLLKGPYSPQEKQFLEASLLAGYDQMGQWFREHRDEQPDLVRWEADSQAACLKDIPESVRALRAAP